MNEVSYLKSYSEYVTWFLSYALAILLDTVIFLLIYWYAR